MKKRSFIGTLVITTLLIPTFLTNALAEPVIYDQRPDPIMLQPIHSDTQPETYGQFESRNFLSVKLYHKCPNDFNFY